MNQSSHSATVQLANAIRRAWQWAASRLAALADDVAALFRRRRRADAVLYLREDGADLFALRTGETPLASVSGRLADVPRLMPRDMVKRLGTGATLRFSAAQAVNKRVVLPAEAADVIGAIIRNKVEGLAPWPLNQAVWGYRAAPVPGTPPMWPSMLESSAARPWRMRSTASPAPA